MKIGPFTLNFYRHKKHNFGTFRPAAERHDYTSAELEKMHVQAIALQKKWTAPAMGAHFIVNCGDLYWPTDEFPKAWEAAFVEAGQVRRCFNSRWVKVEDVLVYARTHPEALRELPEENPLQTLNGWAIKLAGNLERLLKI